MKCVIIDDEPLAREGLAHYVREISFLELVGTGISTADLIALLEMHSVDLIFLDVQLPTVSGIDFLRITPSLPQVILTTAYSNFALESFYLRVTDYLLKPITFTRFYQGAARAREQFLLKRDGKAERHADPPIAAPVESNYFFVKAEGRYEKILTDDIYYVEAMQNYVNIYLSDRRVTTLLNLKAIGQFLDGPQFLRVHKSFIVALPKITAFESHEISLGTYSVPVSRTYRREALQRIVGERLL